MGTEFKKVIMKAEDFDWDNFDKRQFMSFTFTEDELMNEENQKMIQGLKDDGVRVVPMEKGDSIILYSEEPIKLGETYRDIKNAVVTKLFYTPKKWWQFWIKKKQIGFELTWV